MSFKGRLFSLLGLAILVVGISQFIREGSFNYASLLICAALVHLVVFLKGLQFVLDLPVGMSSKWLVFCIQMICLLFGIVSVLGGFLGGIIFTWRFGWPDLLGIPLAFSASYGILITWIGEPSSN